MGRWSETSRTFFDGFHAGRYYNIVFWFLKRRLAMSCRELRHLEGYIESQKRIYIILYYYSNGIIAGSILIYAPRTKKKNLIRYWCAGSEILPLHGLYSQYIIVTLSIRAYYRLGFGQPRRRQRPSGNDIK